MKWIKNFCHDKHEHVFFQKVEFKVLPWCFGKVCTEYCHASLILKVTRHFWSMSGAKWLVTHFENPGEQMIHKFGYFGIRLDGWESFTKHYPRKCLIGRIEINNEVNNDWKSCKKEPLSMQSIIIVPTFWTLACAKVSSSPLIYRSIHFRISMSMFLNHLFCWIFKVLLQVILHLPLIKSVCWPLKSMKHDNLRQRHHAGISNSNFRRKICQR